MNAHTTHTASAAETPRGPDQIDVHVGSRLRLRRVMLNMSQTQLADQLGVSFQQVQKYERGTNRMGASRLFQVATALAVPVTYFYEGLGLPVAACADAPANQDTGADAAVYEFIQSPDGVALARCFVDLGQPVRRRVIDLVRTVSTEGAA